MVIRFECITADHNISISVDVSDEEAIKSRIKITDDITIDLERAMKPFTK